MKQEAVRFVNWVRRRNPQARTWRDYRYDLKAVRAVIGDPPLDHITVNDIDHFVSAQVERGLKPNTVNRRLNTLISLYNFHVIDQPRLVCPVIPRRHMLRAGQRLPRPVPADDLAAFFAAIDNIRDRAMFLLMLRCGLRISEVAVLRLQDLYLRESPPRLLVSGKNSKERSTYISPQANSALRAYLRIRPEVEDTTVFLSYQLSRMSTTAIHKRLMRYRDAAGVSITAHQLRHSFASNLVAVDVPVTTIQKLLGHSWLATTQNYIAANDSQVRRDFYQAAQTLEGWR